MLLYQQRQAQVFEGLHGPSQRCSAETPLISRWILVDG
jgi:hypothetical protein